jgi:hypothetical protein
MAHRFFNDEHFNFELQFALGGISAGCGDIGEMLTTTERIDDGDAESWCAAWTEMAERIAGIAKTCLQEGHIVSARAACLRASTYYSLVLAAVDGTHDASHWLLPSFRAHRQWFDRYVELLDPPGEPVAIPYEGTTMPGYLFRATARAWPSPTLILNNGSDGPITSLWPVVGAGGISRGYNVLVFDGPGQQTMLFEREVPFRHDWEHVITPVVDFLLTRPEVDPDRIALYGISQAGYWVPRALAFEHRIAAGIADPGVYDAFQPWRDALPEDLRSAFDDRDRQRFDELFEAAMAQAQPSARQNWDWRAKPYGAGSPYDVFVMASRYTLDGIVDRITAPMLITDPDDEQFWPGQSQRLASALAAPHRLVPFTAAEGADRHCEPMARSLLEQRLYDWLDETLDVDHGVTPYERATVGIN